MTQGQQVADRSGSLPSGRTIGGLNSCVRREEQVGLIIGLEYAGDDLMLYLIWLTDGNTSARARTRARRAYLNGEVGIEIVPAAGLAALDI